MVNRKIKKNTKSDQRSTIDIDHVAKLANLTLKQDEKLKFKNQLADVLSYFDKLKEVETSKIEPIGQITGLLNVTREDKAVPSINQEDALKNAPRTHNGFFEVDTIFEDQ